LIFHLEFGFQLFVYYSFVHIFSFSIGVASEMKTHGDIKSTADAESTPIHHSPTMPKTTQAMDFDNLPDGCYRSKNFIGSLIAVCLMADSL
jgi:hypothetical protein